MFNFSIQSRINRSTYIVASALGLVVTIAVAIAYESLFLTGVGITLAAIPLFIILAIPVVWSVTLIKRRVNDFSASSTWLLVAMTLLVPFMGLVIAFIPGMKKSNPFGSVPAKGLSL